MESRVSSKPKRSKATPASDPFRVSPVSRKGLTLLNRISTVTGEREKYRLLLRSLGRKAYIATRVRAPIPPAASMPAGDEWIPMYIPAWDSGISIVRVAHPTQDMHPTPKGAVEACSHIVLSVAAHHGFRVVGKTIYC